MNFANLIVGALFGFVLSRAGATHFDFYAQLFLFENLQLLWVIASAVAIGVPGVIVLQKLNPSALITKGPIVFEDRPWRKGLALGALMFGVGWGLTGSCPGSLPAMLGEGKIVMIPALLVLIVGTYGYAWHVSRQLEKSLAYA
jgi:uncharacterized protein